MKRLLIACAIALSIAGCTTLGPVVNNPVTRNELVSAESAYGIVLSSAVAYRKLCADKAIARATCPPIVVKLQNADRKVQVAIKNLRTFVKDNPTVDALSLVIAVKDAVADFQAIANSSGVK